MRGNKTALVLGAGASKNFGFPLGSELKQTIAHNLDIKFDDLGRKQASGSWEIYEAIRHASMHHTYGELDANALRKAGVAIAECMANSSSIDEFVERRRDDPLISVVAKLGIGKVILEAERGSQLGRDQIQNRNPASQVPNSWISALLRDVTGGVVASELERSLDNLVVINFNYDRCFEHYLVNWLRLMYPISEDAASNIAANVRVYHPYGSLGPLPFQSVSDRTAFGAELDTSTLIRIASRIRTYSEAVSDSEAEVWRDDVASAQQIVFLGFGFHEQNIRLLSFPQPKPRRNMRVYATTMTVRPPTLEIIKSRIRRHFSIREPEGLNFFGVNGSCEEFWEEYGVVLTQ